MGNIASGKSTVMAILKNRLPQYCYLSTDDVRRSSGDTPITERQIGDIIINEFHHDLIMIELTGVGNNYSRIKSELKRLNFCITQILLNCKPHICWLRYDERKRSGYKAFAMFNNPGHIKESIYAFEEMLHNKSYDLEIDTIKNGPSKSASLIFELIK